MNTDRSSNAGKSDPAKKKMKEITFNEMKECFEINPIDKTIHPRFIVSCILDHKRANSLTKRLDKHYKYDTYDMPEKMPVDINGIAEQFLEEYKNRYNFDIARRTILRDHLYIKRLKPELRKDIWMITSGAKFKKDLDPQYYHKISNVMKDYPDYFTKQIEIDLKRTFPNKDLNNEDELIKKMKNILTYYARYKLLFHKKRERRNPHIGYCQGMNFIAAKILNVVPEEEDAFWILAALIEDILPIDYFSTMVGVITDQKIFSEMIYLHNKALAKKFTALDADPSLLTLEWFLCCFACTFSEDLANIVWDLLFLEGVTVCFKAGLVFLDCIQDKILKVKEFYEIFEIIKSSANFISPEEFLVKLDNVFVSSKLIKLLRKQYQWVVEEELKYADTKKRPQPNILDQDDEQDCNPDWPICYNIFERQKRKRRNGSVIALRIEDLDENLKENYFSANFKDYPHYISLSDLIKRRQDITWEEETRERKDPEYVQKTMTIGRQKHICKRSRRPSRMYMKKHKRTLTIDYGDRQIEGIPPHSFLQVHDPSPIKRERNVTVRNKPKKGNTSPIGGDLPVSESLKPLSMHRVATLQDTHRRNNLLDTTISSSPPYSNRDADDNDEDEKEENKQNETKEGTLEENPDKEKSKTESDDDDDDFVPRVRSRITDLSKLIDLVKGNDISK